MNPCEWSLFLNALAISIAKNHSSDDLAFLSLVFSQLSTTLALLSFSPSGCDTPEPASEAGAGSAAGTASILNS